MTREEAINILNRDDDSMRKGYFCINDFKAIEVLKSQEPRKGHWKIIPCGNNHGEYRPPKYACSECGWEIDLCRGLQQDTGHRLFCEHCGAKMESENARGDKE